MRGGERGREGGGSDWEGKREGRARALCTEVDTCKMPCGDVQEVRLGSKGTDRQARLPFDLNAATKRFLQKVEALRWTDREGLSEDV